MQDNLIGNTSTIVKTLSLTLAGYILAGLAAQGYDLGIDVNILASLIGAVIGFAISYIDAKYPNSFGWLGNGKRVIETEETVLNDEYEVVNDDEFC